ncbi:MAG: hypothetical protein mread185_000131 [Mycoplasmataceae bacterium]|nr:MAG: hypothetical protein mread185_000131 [Mycoplasmataceae bacterium]
MINSQSQKWLENNFPKFSPKIKSKRRDIISGNLIIEDYEQLSKINLENSKNEREIEKLTLKNLPLLEECFIEGCKIKELVIENCPSIKILHIQRNNLENLNFLENLTNLKELNIDNNKEIGFNCGLKHLPLSLDNFSYQGTNLEKILKDDWKEKRDRLVKLGKKNPRLFWDLTIKYEHLKTVLDSVLKEGNYEPKIIVESTDKIVTSFKKNAEDLIKENQFLQEQNSLFQEKEVQINYLEIRIQELVNLIKNQKQKIIDDFLNVLPEKDLIQQLITSYLEFKKADKQNLDNSLDLEDEYNDIKKELRKKLGNEFVRKIQHILSDCESLVNLEIELENRLKNKSLLIEGQKKNPILQLTNDESKELVLEKRKIIEEEEQTQQSQLIEFEKLKEQNLSLQLAKAKLEGRIETYEKLIPVDQKERLILELTNNPAFFKQLISQVRNYLNSKQLFINTRKETIILLQEIVNLMEQKTVVGSGKYVRLEKGSKLVVSAVKASPVPVPYVKEVIAETIPLIIDHFKGKFKNESVELFKEHLEKNDNTNEIKRQRILLTELINKHSELSSVQLVNDLLNLKDNNQFFTNEHEIYQVATNIWEDKPTLTLDDMKSTISELGKNIKFLERELKNEMSEISKFNSEINKLEKTISLQLENQIVDFDINK